MAPLHLGRNMSRTPYPDYRGTITCAGDQYAASPQEHILYALIRNRGFLVCSPSCQQNVLPFATGMLGITPRTNVYRTVKEAPKRLQSELAAEAERREQEHGLLKSKISWQAIPGQYDNFIDNLGGNDAPAQTSGDYDQARRGQKRSSAEADFAPRVPIASLQRCQADCLCYTCSTEKMKGQSYQT